MRLKWKEGPWGPGSFSTKGAIGHYNVVPPGYQPSGHPTKFVLSFNSQRFTLSVPGPPGTPQREHSSLKAAQDVAQKFEDAQGWQKAALFTRLANDVLADLT